MLGTYEVSEYSRNGSNRFGVRKGGWKIDENSNV